MDGDQPPLYPGLRKIFDITACVHVDENKKKKCGLLKHIHTHTHTYTHATWVFSFVIEAGSHLWPMITLKSSLNQDDD